MDVSARTALTNGPCQSVEVTSVRRMYPADFYAADLQFSNGQTIKNVPTYVPLTNGEQTARQVAAQIGAAAANAGVLDLYELARNGTLPFSQFLFARAVGRQQELAKELGVAIDDLPYIMSVSTRSQSPDAGTWSAQVLFAHNNKLVGSVSLSLPSGRNSESLEPWLREIARQTLGEPREASLLKVHPRTINDADAPIMSVPRRESMYHAQDGIWRVEMFFDDENSLSLSLGSRDQTVAKSRADALWERSRLLLHEQGHFTRQELKDYVETLKELVPDTQPGQAHLEGTRLGAIKLRYPTNDGGCKVYLKWTGRRLRTHIGPLHGTADTANWVKGSITIPADLHLTSEQMGELKANLWSFVHDRLAQAFAEGYRFHLIAYDEQGHVVNGPIPESFQKQAQGLALTQNPDLAELELTLTPNGTIGFTPRGWDRLKRDIFQGRLDSEYVSNALAAGYTNPFAMNMSEHLIRDLRLGQGKAWSL